MIYHIKASGSISEDSRSFETVVKYSVPADKEPNEISFSLLPSPSGKTFEVSENHGHLVKFGKDPYLVRAVGLISCASVCFVNRADSSDLRGYVYHANTGTVPWEKFGEIMKEIGATDTSAYKHVQVLYAHPNATDSGYQRNLDELNRWLYDRARVIEVTHLFISEFGMNHSVEVGY